MRAQRLELRRALFRLTVTLEKKRNDVVSQATTAFNIVINGGVAVSNQQSGLPTPSKPSGQAITTHKKI